MICDKSHGVTVHRCFTFVMSCTEIIRCRSSDQEKYQQMASIIDGSPMNMLMHVEGLQVETFGHLRQRLTDINRRMQALSTLHVSFCRLCSAIKNETVSHTAGCPSMFNICYKCLGRHVGAGCANPLFKVAHNFCWKCWMPLYDIFGISFHSKKVNEIGHGCASVGRDFLKPLACAFFHKRQIAKVQCPSTDTSHYQRWLFQGSGVSAAGSGQIPNILVLLEVILKDFKMLQ